MAMAASHFQTTLYMNQDPSRLTTASASADLAEASIYPAPLHVLSSCWQKILYLQCTSCQSSKAEYACVVSYRSSSAGLGDYILSHFLMQQRRLWRQPWKSEQFWLPAKWGIAQLSPRSYLANKSQSRAGSSGRACISENQQTATLLFARPDLHTLDTSPLRASMLVFLAGSSAQNPAWRGGNDERPLPGAFGHQQQVALACLQDPLQPGQRLTMTDIQEQFERL